ADLTRAEGDICGRKAPSSSGPQSWRHRSSPPRLPSNSGRPPSRRQLGTGSAFCRPDARRVPVIRVVEACARRIGIRYADLAHVRFRAFHFDSGARLYFAGTSLILSPPFATGMTQIGVATSAEPRSDV